jgi:hypothetical protein
MKQWLCVLAACGCGLMAAQSAELRQTPISPALDDASAHLREAETPVSIGLAGPAMALVGLNAPTIFSVSWSELQGGCLVPETGAFAGLLSFVRGAAIRARADHEKEALLRMTSLLILMLLLGLTAAICVEPEQRRILEPR